MENKLYLGVDYSVAKSGCAIVSVKNRKPILELAYLIETDKEDSLHERIDKTVTEIKHLAQKNKISDIIREEGFVGRAETAIPIAKAHAIFEYQLMYMFNLDTVYNTTIKAWSRKIIGKKAEKELKESVPKTRFAKELIHEALKKYYGEIPELTTPRGRYIDDIGDAIALITIWLEQNDLIDELHRFESL